MSTRIVCGHTTCKHNYKNWCSLRKIELAIVPSKNDGDIICLQKEKKK